MLFLLVTRTNIFIFNPWHGLHNILNLMSGHIIDRGLNIANILKRTPQAKKKYQRGNNKRNIWMMDMTIVATKTKIKAKERIVRMDTESFEIGIDNRASYCISPIIGDFGGPMEECKKDIKGFLGTTTKTFKKRHSQAEVGG